MLCNKPFLIDDIDRLREEVLALENSTGRKSELWKMIKTSSRSAPMSFGWFVPFVALITRDRQDIENARKIIFTYIDKLDPMSFCSGLQFHFWCFAFPHAKVSMYFQWLCTIGAFSEEEKEYIAGRLVEYHFLNFYYGLRTKPEPETVDNQTLSLALSTTMVGYIFSQGEKPFKMAEIMLRDGSRRLPQVIGDMPLSGYSGEGSSYMDCVNGPAIPLAVEVLELITGEENLLFKEFEPSGAKPISVLKMTAREWMPGGLLLPWDNYGYQFGVRSPIAYGAKKTGLKLFYNILEKECIWTYDIGVGWAYDDLVWTLIWWPDEPCTDTDDGANWFEPAVGGTLVSSDKTRYVMQMWDESAPVIPTRAHVNPNGLIFNGFGVPISADGSPMPGISHRFQFEDTWRVVSFMDIGSDRRYNYGDGCGGAHSVILVDGRESLRAYGEYEQVVRTAYDPERKYIYADVTPIYRENFEDIMLVTRKTQLHCDTFFTVEETFRSQLKHKVTSRFLFRPELVPAKQGVKIKTPEGVTLHIFDLLNNNEIRQEHVENHPFKPDGCSRLVDFSLHSDYVKRLFLVFISRTIEKRDEIVGFKAAADKFSNFDYQKALEELDKSELVLPMKLPAYMEAEVPNIKTWWYSRRIEKRRGKAYIILPAGMHDPRLFINGREIDLSPYNISMELISPYVPIPGEFEELTTLDIVLKVNVPEGHYDGGGDGTIGISGGMWLGYPVEEEVVRSAKYENSKIIVTTNLKEYTADYALDEGGISP